MKAKTEAQEIFDNIVAFANGATKIDIQAYRCSKCKKVVIRSSTKAWIKSYCDVTGEKSRLVMIHKQKQPKQ